MSFEADAASFFHITLHVYLAYSASAYITYSNYTELQKDVWYVISALIECIT